MKILQSLQETQNAQLLEAQHVEQVEKRKRSRIIRQISAPKTPGRSDVSGVPANEALREPQGEA